MLTQSQKKELIDSYDNWWHSIDFGDGLVTRGKKNTQCHKNEENWFPHDFFNNKRVLDVGAWDGYYSFYAEKMGANEVVAVDRYVWEGNVEGVDKKGFDIAKKILGSKVKDFTLYVEEMTPSILGTFDSIIYAGVFYHLKNPYQSLEILDRLLNVGGRIMLESDMRNTGISTPLMQFIPKNSSNNDSTNYWSPNGACIKYMFEEIGNYTVESMNEGGIIGSVYGAGTRGTVVLRKN